MWREYTYLGSRNTGNRCLILWRYKQPNPKKVLAIRNTQRREEQVILSTILCKATESIPQAGNNETTNLQEHA